MKKRLIKTYETYKIVSKIKNDAIFHQCKIIEEFGINNSFLLTIPDFYPTTKELSILKFKYKKYCWIFFNEELLYLWIKSLPKKIDISKYKYLYHYAHSNDRDHILKNGLTTTNNLTGGFGYENLLFFYIDISNHDINNYQDIWIIEPIKFNNVWYEDPNIIAHGYEEGAVCTDSNIKVTLNNLRS